MRASACRRQRSQFHVTSACHAGSFHQLTAFLTDQQSVFVNRLLHTILCADRILIFLNHCAIRLCHFTQQTFFTDSFCHLFYLTPFSVFVTIRICSVLSQIHSYFYTYENGLPTYTQTTQPVKTYLIPVVTIQNPILTILPHEPQQHYWQEEQSVIPSLSLCILQNPSLQHHPDSQRYYKSEHLPL